MSMSVHSKDWSPLARRLLPLNIAAFSQGLVLWYAIEKLFMTSIGFNDATIGVMVAFYAGLMPFIETPSGILADRWSRKGVLVLATIFLMLTSLIGGLSHSVPMYIVAALCWAVFFGMYSGTYDSIIYDAALEETGTSDQVEKHLGRFRLYDSIALVLGSLAGGALAAAFSPRLTYFLTIPCLAISLFALWKFKEPILHRKEAALPMGKHVQETFRAILTRGRLFQIVACMVVMSFLDAVILEFSQLWMIALVIPVFFYGPANAAVLGALGIGGMAAGRVQLDRKWVVIPAALLMVGGSLVLALAKNALLIVIAQVVLTIIVIGLGVLLTRLLHDGLPSRFRAGSASAVSTLSWLLFLPFALIFGALSERQSIFHAAWMVVGLTVVASGLLVKAFTARHFRPLPVVKEDLPLAETYAK
jgi:predicted MFS family arabinose efflux permease